MAEKRVMRKRRRRERSRRVVEVDRLGECEGVRGTK